MPALWRNVLVPPPHLVLMKHSAAKATLTFSTTFCLLLFSRVRLLSEGRCACLCACVCVRACVCTGGEGDVSQTHLGIHNFPLNHCFILARLTSTETPETQDTQTKKYTTK